jgi:hypothetical protein
VGVDDSGHGVDFEIFVWHNLWYTFNWSPTCEGWLGIIEPFVAKVLNVVVVNVGNSGGDLTSWNSSAKLEDLPTNSFVELSSLGSLNHQLIVEVVSASYYLDIIEVVRVDGWEANSAVVHLSGEDLISVEVVTEETAIRVCEVVRIGLGDIWELSEERVHRVVLLVGIIQVFSMLIDSVGAEHVLEEQEGVEVLVLSRWGIIEDSNVWVDHLIISHEENWWSIDWLVSTSESSSGGLWKPSKVLVYLFTEFIVVNITSSNNNDVITEVMGGVEISEMVNTDGTGQISITLSWLTEHMVSERVVVGVGEGGLFVSSVVGFMFSANVVLEELELSWVEGWVAYHITEELDGPTGIVFENLEAMADVLLLDIMSIDGTHVFDISLQFGLWSAGCTSKSHLLEEVADTVGIWAFVSWSCTAVDSNVGNFRFDFLCTNSDSIWKRCLLEWSDVFEGFWDLSKWKFTEVAHDWTLGELQEWCAGWDTWIVSSLQSVFLAEMSSTGEDGALSW